MRRLGIAALIVIGCGSEAAQPRFSPAPGSPFPAGSRPAAVRALDIDSDGDVDLAVADSGGDTVTVLRGDGRGRFVRANSFAALAQPHLLVTGDFNSDRKPDVVASAHDSNDVALLINDGRGGLLPPRILALFPAGRAHNHGLAAADLDGDGHLDLTAGHQDLDQITVLLGDGRGGFRSAEASPVATGRSPYPHVIADVNGDGKLDLVVPNVQGGYLSVLTGDGSGRLQPSGRVDTGIARPYSVVIADINRDRKVDLIVTHDDTSRVAVMLGQDGGSFRHAPGSPFDAGKRGWGVAIGDLDGDDLPDLTIAGSDLRLFRGDGTGRFQSAGTIATGGSWDVVLADVNGDGRLDIIAPDSQRNAVHVFLSAAR